MSWNFTVERINQSLERLVGWYREFMARTEQSFRALHQRILYLEDRQSWQGPSDEQVERVMRKILAERFADAGTQQVENPNHMKDGAYFVQNPKEDQMIPKPLPIDFSALQVDPNKFPSEKYGQTLQMLESDISTFPQGIDKATSDGQVPNEFKRPKQPSSNQQHSRPWS
ncbi:hypothetical protein K491DRAFT_592896 [Lophiostoma macrostomum CBS 122681]|uniref:Uncharacterized protein n=1 Tax=Lophiostoma macrostomum CBS 122681 TaxID=1314788 RepID=A0A6A6TFJ7_9PLEO|nr:hypothetical protein K491DRAFT_592896 [Lophiostoma macrostomum CBS 122681]